MHNFGNYQDLASGIVQALAAYKNSSPAGVRTHLIRFCQGYFRTALGAFVADEQSMIVDKAKADFDLVNQDGTHELTELEMLVLCMYRLLDALTNDRKCIMNRINNFGYYDLYYDVCQLMTEVKRYEVGLREPEEDSHRPLLESLTHLESFHIDWMRAMQNTTQ